MDIGSMSLNELEQLVQDIKNQLGKKLQPDLVFTPGHVPVKVAARVYGKDANWVRSGIITQRLPIGSATRGGKLVKEDVNEMNSSKGRIDYYISPKLLYEHTGYYWKGEKE